MENAITYKKYHITSLTMRTKMVLEMSDSFTHLTRLITSEDFIESCHCESLLRQFS
jgi:hypothetical protein